MIREEYTPSSVRIRWWSIAEKPQRAAFVKKDRDQGGRKTLGPLERQYLVLSRNTGKSFHRFPLSIRSEWHQNPVGLTPFSPDRTCLFLSLSPLTAWKNTRGRKDEIFPRKILIEMGYPCALSRSILQSYPVGGIDTLPRSFLCIKFEVVADFLSKSFLEKGGERERNLLEFFVNWIVSRSTSRARHTLHKHSVRGINDSSTPTISAEWDSGRIDANYRNNLIGEQSGYAMKIACPSWTRGRNVYWN